MKRIAAALIAFAGLISITTPDAQADYTYGNFGPGYPYYSRWRPWWGGLHGWGSYHGCSAYPAYPCAPTSGYRHRPGLFPPSSSYYGYPDYQGGYAQYPREFIYDWQPDEGDEQPTRPGVQGQFDPERQ